MTAVVYKMATDDIPVIDISNMNDDTGDQLVEAVHKWGFAFVKGSNTGLSALLIDHAFELVCICCSRNGFRQPD